MTDEEGGAPHWWQTWWGAGSIALFCALPLLWPDIPPLLDLPGHMAAYKVELDYAHSPNLQHYYTLHWAVIGNLGVNLLVIPLAKLFGLEPAVKLIVLFIPPLTVAGLLWVAREVHGRIPPTALFAVPLAYCYPFIFGFVNFALSMALGLLAFALWLALERRGQLRLRALLFPFVSALVWLCHTFGWGLLGILAFSVGLVRQADRGQPPLKAGFRSALSCLPLVTPIILMLIWRTGDVAGKTEGWFNLVSKANYMIYLLRDRWQILDLGSALILYGLILVGLATRRLNFSRHLGASVISLLIVYVILPQRVFGSGYADMRLFSYAVAVALIALRLPETMSRDMRRRLAVAGLAFIFIRISANTLSFLQYDRAFARELPALDRVPRGARLLSFVGTPCRNVWKWTRLDHLPALAVVRREAFSNDQWSVAGAQLDLANYPQAGEFEVDPSQIVWLTDCPPNRWRTLDDVLAHIPPGAFDYLWLIEPPAYNHALARNLVPIWTNGRSVLFRIQASGQSSTGR
jgi:hypothetical protein